MLAFIVNKVSYHKHIAHQHSSRSGCSTCVQYKGLHSRSWNGGVADSLITRRPPHRTMLNLIAIDQTVHVNARRLPKISPFKVHQGH